MECYKKRIILYVILITIIHNIRMKSSLLSKIGRYLTNYSMEEAELTEIEIAEISAHSRPLANAWYSVERKISDANYRNSMRALFTSMVFNGLSVGMMAVKVTGFSPASLLYNFVQTTLSLVGLVFVLISIFAWPIYSGNNKTALNYISSRNLDFYLKVTTHSGEVNHFNPARYHSFYSESTTGVINDFLSEVAGLLAIGGFKNVKTSWLNDQDDDLLVLLGVREYIASFHLTPSQQENFLVLKSNFEGTLGELITVSKIV